VQTTFETITDALFMEAKLHGEEHGVTFVDHDKSEQRFSYATVFRRALHASEALARSGVGEGSRVIVVVPTGPSFLDAFFGTICLGGIPCPLSPPVGVGGGQAFKNRIGAIARLVDATAVATIERLAPLVSETLPEGVKLVLADELGVGFDESAELREPHRATGKDAAFIQFTSGSTATSRGVVLSHEAILSNIHQIGWGLDLGPEDKGLSWLPLYHDMGLIGCLLFAIYWDLDSIFLSPRAFVRNPVTWLETISRHRVTLSAGPNFAYAYAVQRARPRDLEKLDLSCWRVTCCGAEPIDRRVLDTFVETFAPCGLKESVFLPCYGLAEATLAVTFHEAGIPFEVDRVSRTALAAGRAERARGDDPDGIDLVSCGRPLPEMGVRVVDETGENLKERAVGEILVWGPTLMTEYFRQPDLTSEALSEGWLRTGDLGYLADGRLFVTGRRKELIIVRGRNYYPQDLEWCAAEVEGIRNKQVCAYSHKAEAHETEQVTLVVETRVTDPKELAKMHLAIRRRVMQHTGVAVSRVEFVPSGTLTKTSSGKLQRGRIKLASLARLAAAE
jgi:fatty-acyl-CoA synthase